MEIYNFIIENKELFKLIYTIIIGLACFIIVVRTNKLFRLSFHQGIRYFRNAFFFYGLAFILRWLLGTSYFLVNWVAYPFVMKAVFEFFLVTAGFSLLYSLLWKRLEREKDKSSLFNTKVFIFYILALIIVILDYLWQTYCFMFASQIILFSYASVISYINCRRSEKQQIFLRLYFVVIVLNLIAWLLNFTIATVFNWNQIGVINIYILNAIIFLLFLYGVVRTTKKSNAL